MIGPLRIDKRFLNEIIVNVPTIAESITECDLKELSKGKGDYVDKDEQIAVLETDKIVTSVNAPEAGVITEVYAELDQTVEIGSKLFKLDTDAKKPVDKDNSSATEEAKQPTTPSPKQQQEVKKSEGGMPSLKSTGEPKPRGQLNQSEKKETTKQTQDTDHKTPLKTHSEYNRNQTIVPISRIRLRIAERLKDAQNQAAFLTTFNEVDMSAVINMRAKYGAAFIDKHKIKLGFMGIFLKACATALMECPQVNSLMSGKTFTYSDYVDISVAVATEKGLVTPIIRNCNAISIATIEKELANLSLKARENKLAIEDMTGGTFTISNGGVFGSLMGTPILNPPQSAILGMHATKNRPIDVNGKVEIRPMMYLALTYDHRVIDGKEAVSFLVNVKNLIEDPLRFILEL